ncbi:MAG TPA: hypothetical protein VMW91_01120 [Desulfosporosinus sp.]|nr:hypothetical protein [Desulfosporosinus sp.]
MNAIIAFLTKIMTWLKMNGATIIAALQLAVKTLKEVITAVLNFVSLVLPTSKVEAFILKIRELINSIDALLEKAKAWLLVNVI